MKFKSFLLLAIIYQLGILQLKAQYEVRKPLDKKSGFVALLLSYSNTKKENSKTLLENVKTSDVSNFSVRSGGGYFFKKYFAVGLGLDYGSEKEKAENINTFGPNTILHRHVRTYTFTPFIRNYLPVGAKDRFYLFTQTGLELEVGNGEESTLTGTSSTYADIKKREFGLAFTPGVILLVQKGFAFEVNVGVLGLNHSKETITPTGQPQTEISRTNFNFEINLLKLNLGISYYF